VRSLLGGEWSLPMTPSMRRGALQCLWVSAALAVLGVAGGVRAEPEPLTQNAEDAVGFGPSTDAPSAAVPSADAAATPPESSFPLPHISIKLRQRAGLWLERTEPSRLAQHRTSVEVAASHSLRFTLAGKPANFRSALGGRLEFDQAFLLHRAEYDRTTIDAYELRFIGLESFVGLTVGGLSVRTGRLLNPLGQGEILSVVDVLNPRDLRQLGLTDPESMRLPAWTSHLTFAKGDHRIDGYVVHEAYFGMLPPMLGRFNPVRKLLVADVLAGEELQDRDFRMQHVPSRLDPKGTQALARYGYTGRGVDLELYAGSVLDQIGVALLPSPTAFDAQRVTFHIQRYTMLAHAGSWAVGDFVLRWEASTQLKRAQAVRQTRYASPVLEVERRTQLGGLMGLTYFGLTDANLGLELAKSVVLGNPERRDGSERALLWPVESLSLAGRYQHNLYRERIQLSAATMVVGVRPFTGALLQLVAGYLIRDGFWGRVEYVHYQATDHFGMFYGFERNDRLDFTLTWSVAAL